MQRKRNLADVEAARAMVAIGGPGNRVADVARRFGISHNTAKQWVDPEHYEVHVRKSRAWQVRNAGRVAERARVRRAGLSDAGRERIAAASRRRYAVAGSGRFGDLVAGAGPEAQALLAGKLRRAAMGWSGRLTPVFGKLMQAVSGCTQEEFTLHFDGDERLEYVVPLVRFDLTKPAHVARANHPSNLRLGEPVAAAGRGRDAMANEAAIMALQWSGNPDAMVLAQTFISRQLARAQA